jgi:hypothetical protein
MGENRMVNMGWWNKLVRNKKEAEVETKDIQTPEDIRRAALEQEKQQATKDNKPWVAVLDTQVNWNNQFIEDLLDAGYKGETNEQIVDAWFRTIVSQMLEEDGQDPKRDAGYINVVPIDKSKSEVS